MINSNRELTASDPALTSAILGNMAEGVCLVRVSDGHIIYSNPKFESMFGYEAGEMTGMHVARLNFEHQPGEAAEIASNLMGDILRNQVFTYEIENIKKNGTRFWSRATTSTFNHAKFGRVFIAVQQDITDLKIAHHKIEESEARYRTFFNSAYDAIVVTDLDGTIIMVNPRSENLFGYTARELVGQKVEILIPTRFQARHIEARAKFTARPHSRPMGTGLELIGCRKDGSEFPIDISLSSFSNQNGCSFTVTVRDMTHHKNTEDELRKLNAQAELAIKTREDILAIVSHDLKNPLSAVLLNSQLLTKIQSPCAKIQEKIKLISTQLIASANQMQRLIYSVLDYSKLQSGTFSIEPRIEALSEIVDTLLNTMRSIALEKSIALETCTNSSKTHLNCDRDRINQVLSNLLGNAIKFTPRNGKIVISISDSEDILKISISDSGCGIPAAQLPHLFERYWQNKETARFGTGLGLFIAKGIVDAHRGRIWAESSVGKGSTFHVTFPKDAASGLMQSPALPSKKLATPLVSDRKLA